MVILHGVIVVGPSGSANCTNHFRAFWVDGAGGNETDHPVLDFVLTEILQVIEWQQLRHHVQSMWKLHTLGVSVAPTAEAAAAMI